MGSPQTSVLDPGGITFCPAIYNTGSPSQWTGGTGTTAEQQDALVSMLATFVGPAAQRGGKGATQDSKSLSASSGGGFDVPELEAPSGAASTAGLELMIGNLAMSGIQNRTTTALTDLDAKQRKIDASSKLQMESLQKWVDASAKAEHKGLFSKILGWVGKVAAVIGAAVAMALAAAATVATGGAAAPMLVLTTVAFGAAAISLADQISRSAGGGGVSLSGGISNLVSGALQKLGMPAEQAKKWSSVVTGAVALACPVLIALDPAMLGNVAGGIAALAGASQSTVDTINMISSIVVSVAVAVVMVAATFGMGTAAAAGSVAQTLANIGARVSNINQVTQGVTTSAKSGVDISIASDVKDASLAKADEKAQLAFMDSLQDLYRNVLDDLRKLGDSLSQIASVQSNALSSNWQMTQKLCSGQRGPSYA